MLFIGCKITLRYTETNPTLLVGEVVFTENNYIGEWIYFDSATPSDYEIVLRNTATNNISRFSSLKNGIFCGILQDGEYCIEKLIVKKTRSDGAWASAVVNPALKVLEVERGKVNNIGTIQWSVVNERNYVIQKDNSADINFKFSQQFPESTWNQKEWKYQQLSFDVKQPSDPMYNEENSTLLVGKVVFTGGSYDSEIWKLLNDTITSGIEMVLKNIATNETLRFPADKNGLFYVNLQDGKYWIDEIYIKKEDYDGTFAITSTKPALKALEVENGKVNNIGTIQWYAENRKHSVIQIDNSSDIKTAFFQKIPKSTWNQKEWKYEQLSFDVKQPSVPQYTTKKIRLY